MSSMSPARPAPPRPGAPRPKSGATPFSAPSIDPFRVLRRHILGICASGVIGGVLGVIVWLAVDFLYPLYTGMVLFEVQAGVVDPTKLGSRDIAQEDTVTRLATTETRLMISREVLVDALKSPEIARETQWAKAFPDEKGSFSIEDAVDELEEELSASPVRNTNLFVLRWSTHVDKDVPIVLKAISDAYLVRRASQENEVYDKNLKLFKQQLDQTNREIDDQREEITVFIREKGITTLDDPRFNQVSLKIADLLNRISNAQDQLSLVQTNYLQISQKLDGTLEPTSEDQFAAERDPIIQRHNSDILNIKTELERLRDKYPDPSHSAIVELERRLSAYEGARDTAIHETILKNLNAGLKDLANQRMMLDDLLRRNKEDYDNTDKQLRNLAADMAVYLDLQKRRDLLELKRDENNKMIQELNLMRLRADAARVRKVQDALTPRNKSFPVPELMIPLVTIVVVAGTIAAIFLRELTDSRVKTASDLAIIPGARVVGIIPDLEEDPTKSESAEMVVRKHPQSVLAESYRQAVAPIIKGLAAADHQSLLLVGGMPGAGTTTVATNLAVACAAAGKRVILIDANFRRPRLAEALGALTEGVGLGDLLAKAVAVDQAIVRVDDGIDLIRAGTPASRVFERLQNGQFPSLMAELRDRYDLIVIDTPPAVVAGEAIALAARVDAAVLVVRAGQEERGLVARVISQISDTQCQLIGIILNRARGTAGGYFKKNFAAMAEYARSSGA